MRKWQLIFVSVLITSICIYLSLKLYPGSNGFGALNFSMDREQIISSAKKLAALHHVILSSNKLDIKLLNDRRLVREIHENFGLEKGNEILRTIVPGYWWDLKWEAEDGLDIVKGSGESDSPGHSENGKSGLHFKYDTHGNLIYFSRDLADSLKSNRLNLSQAKEIVYDFAHTYAPQVDLAGATLVDNKVSVEPYLDNGEEWKRKAHLDRPEMPKSFDFKWLAKNETAQKDIEIIVTVSGGRVTKFDVAYVLDEKEQMDEMSAGLFLAVFIIAIATITLILAFKKSRAFEIRFRLALILGLIMLVLYTVEIFFLVSRSTEWQVLLLIMLGPLFIAGTFVLVWAVGESAGRESWKDKFIPLDLLVNGHVFHSKLGEGILRGFTLGSLSFLAFLVLTWLLSRITTLSAFTTSEYVQDMFASNNPALFIISHSFWSNMYVLAVNFLLIMAIIFKKTGKGQLTILLASVPLAIVMEGQIQPIYFGLFIKSLALVFLLWGFYRFDLLTAFISLMTYRILDVALSYAFADDLILQNSWTILMVIFGLMIVYAAITIFTRDGVTDFSEIEPVLAKFINERQRMQQELKIARDVQMSFLPSHIPIIPGLDIASQCVPALNVGGDYFDFVRIGPKKIGVAIGDVSGKGIRAAFYMTLVKGFLKALSRTVYSPAELLKELNILFFENAKRDAFISMVYGVFDTERKVLVLARSGHNPVILYRKSNQELTVIKTEGLALGLEKGILFNKIMQETEINIEVGDIIVFYTDGFTEARNKSNEEFGEEKFEATIKYHADNSAEEILKELFTEVTRFSRGQIQHDDMSVVVVKVT